MKAKRQIDSIVTNKRRKNSEILVTESEIVNVDTIDEIEKNKNMSLVQILKLAATLPHMKGGWSISSGLVHLMNIDERFTPLILKCDIPELYIKPDTSNSFDPFLSLVHTIVHQQLAVNVAQSVCAKVESAFTKSSNRLITPNDVLNADIEIKYIDDKKKIVVNGMIPGLSESKLKYLQSLAEHFNDSNKLKDVNLFELNDDELFEKLVSVKGLGAWSVHIFMLFTLKRSNVLPIGDLGFRRGLTVFHGLSRDKFEGKKSENDMVELCKSWAPYSSLASLYMWKLSDETKKRLV